MRESRGRRWLRGRGTVELSLVAAATAAAAVLRFVHVGAVPPDPFYDAAVRSMTLSWHNFFFGAFEPGGSVSIDKPPVDLWLQVLSVKLFGFTSTALKLPEAIAGTASVPLLYAVLRRIWSAPAGIAAAWAMAILPIEVITARSDTMDGVMMLLILVALAMIVRAIETGRLAWLLGGAAAFGVAFDVKLLESLIALPALAAFAFLGLPGPRGRRALKLLVAGGVYVLVALSWLTATLLFPAHERPYAIGSTNGSAWNAAFVFNGTDRLGGKSPEPGATLYEPGHHYPVATQEERDHIPITPPSPTRLLTTVGPLSGERLGLELLMGLLLGAPALAWGLRARPGEKDVRVRLRRATAAGLGLWLLAGVALYSHMIRLHPRYIEAFTPAVAAILGIGLAWAATPPVGAKPPGDARESDGAGPDAGTTPPAGPSPLADAAPPGEDVGSWEDGPAWTRARLGLLVVALVVGLYYGERLLYGFAAPWWISLAGAIGAVACALLARHGARDGRGGSPSAWLAPGAVIAFALVAVLAIPLKADSTAIADRVSDAGLVGALPAAQERPLSRYLLAHQDGSYYELAAESATAVGSLIVQDARPVLMLTTYDARVFTSVPRLQRLIALGKVRYAYLNSFCTSEAASVNAACSAPVKWIRAHGTDVSLKAGLPRGGLLYLLPGARP